MSHHPTEEEAMALRRDPEVKKRLREFLETDNYTNFLYIFRAYLISALAIGAVVAFGEWHGDFGISKWWGVPVYLFALLAVGASQHQLAGAGHEAVHHTLFKNRKLNELVGDFLCMFPVMTSVFQFRLYHLAHHQFVNDPEKDPDYALLKQSGHWMKFPVEKFPFLAMMLRQLLLIDLIRYILVRVKFNTTGTHDKSPYRLSNDEKKRGPARLAVAFFLFIVLNSILVQKWGEPWMLLAFPAAGWALYAGVLKWLPDSAFDRTRVKPVFHQRYMFMGQGAVFAVIVASLSFIQSVTDFAALRYFSAVWYVSMVTTFPLFLILRQVIQHGNGDRGWLTNTRVFRMSSLVRYAIFPFGMDYHLPHHMYATIPHYRLKAFHEFLMTREEYRKNCQLVDNYLVPDSAIPRNPTVVEVLGPDYAGSSEEIHIDNSVLDDLEVEEKELILENSTAAR